MKTIRFVSACALLAATIGNIAHAQESGVPSVVIATVKGTIVSQIESYVARVAAINTVNVEARVTGYLETRNFTEGSFVKRGDLLYQIERGPFEAAVAQYKADVEGAEATLKNDTLDLERQTYLLSKGDVAQTVVDAATATLGVSRAATANARAELEAAQIDLGYTRIYSPIDGRIGISAIDVGNVVSTDSGTLATINSVDPIHVIFYISERDLLEERRNGLITGGSSTFAATLTLADGETYPQKGAVVYVDTEVQETTDTIELRASFPNADSVLLPGQFVSLTLENPNAQPIVAVPQAALQLDKEGHFVFVVNDKDTVERRNVSVGRTKGTLLEIEKGLTDGERVIVEGLQKVHAGQQVKAVTAQGQSDQ
ncbi:efflux RND transporter periplasmic adaptor subunit [Hoeflea prorocentri]|uniref:Efflux RND transporter periplasmic adaptor subunit n=1 Tax=Hoeflea prorocentri TaxID=1922333 RepID=A0A9X3UN89_9HYPH|nr:efflux RND transporter periplasmic adaptor subunit [Hoeflea prorocentri]MCY6383769.1 efflux RND transporter periplasmic adaptor subunit [Hoeflea prorocentri]MDA5401569.1 efflux RND transporter periplasmic adaptor subunit [Hoeflea prorocentri]